MEEPMWTVTDLLRKNYFNSEQSIRLAIRDRRWPKPRKIAGRLLWEPERIRAWVASGAVCWIPRTNKP